MYDVNSEEIRKRIEFIGFLIKAVQELRQNWQNGDVFLVLAQERLLHLSIEAVTDIGSYLIDGFMLREASSYEDIIEILKGEQVVDDRTAHLLSELVKLRRPLVQSYADWDRTSCHSLLELLPGALERFSDGVSVFMEKEMF